MENESSYNYGIHQAKVDSAQLFDHIPEVLKVYFWYMTLPTNGPLMASIDGWKKLKRSDFIWRIKISSDYWSSLLTTCKNISLHETLQHAPGVPKVLVGNRLHLAFKRQVGERDAEAYAAKNRMAFFEVSPLCDFNIRESFSELSRMALHRNGMERLWRSNKGID